MNSIALSIPVIQHWLKLLGNQETKYLVEIYAPMI